MKVTFFFTSTKVGFQLPKIGYVKDCLALTYITVNPFQDCLYHHPVHKISFIAQDVQDSRAFGYIYGSPENGHRFFGIKTEKAAGQVTYTCF